MRWSLFSCCILVAASPLARGSDEFTNDPNLNAAGLTVVDPLKQDYPGVRYALEHGRIARIHGAAFGFGGSPEATAAAFVERYAGVLSADPKDLAPRAWFRAGPNTQPVMPDRVNGGFKFTLVYYSQERDGVPVFRGEARLLVRNEPDFPLVLVSANVHDLGDFRVTGPVGNVVSEAAVAAVMAVDADLVAFSQAEVVIFAGYDDVRSEPRLAVSFIADNGFVGTDLFKQSLFVTDAATGEILFQENQILHVDVSGTVQGMATTGWGADACAAEVATGMPYARVEISGGNFAYAAANGTYTIPNAGSGAVTVNSPLAGQWFVINDEAGAESFLTTNVTPPGPANFVHSAPNSNPFERAQVNAYLHANVVRDFALSANAAYPDLGNQMQVFVNIASTCNAFYDPAIQTINFYQSGDGCNNTAFSTVVHHEYGHHLVARAGSGQGAYGEGTGDCMGVLISDTSPLGVGFQSCATGIRNASNSCQYQASGCSSCGSAIHTCGQVISGCVWETRNELILTNPGDYRTILADLCVNAILLHTGSSITPQITIDWITLDDDDANPANGSPHYNQINTGFTEHSMPAPSLPLIAFSYPNGQPTAITPAGGGRVRVVVTGLAGTPQPGSGMLHYSTGGAFTAIAMEQITPNVYDAVFPAFSCGSLVRWYVSAQSTTAVTNRSPDDAPTTTFRVRAAYGVTMVLADNFEADLGWTVQNTGLLDGPWGRGVPADGGRGDPPSDYDGSGQCYVTDNVAGNSDVDGGTTDLVSPTLNLSSGDAIISYARWFDNNVSGGSNPQTDPFTVYVSNNNGSSWTTVETVGPVGVEADGGWYARSFTVSSFVAPTAQVRVRFRAADPDPGSIVEAGIDAVFVEQINCTPPGFAEGDANCDGTVDFFDIDPFLMALFDPSAYATTFCGGNTDTADVNDSGAVDFFDIDPFLAVLFP